MGSSCSSAQGDNDKDNGSVKSEGSPYYTASSKRDGKKQQENHTSGKGATQQQNNTHSTIMATGGGGDTGMQIQNSASPTEKRGPVNRLLHCSGPSVMSGDSMSLSSPTGAILSPHDIDPNSGPTLPKEVSELPENLKHLMVGRISNVRPHTKGKKITLYVCAADSQDCQMEKGSLHSRIYPALSAHCLEKGYELHITDLHWKTELERRQDHQFPELCLGELNRQMETAYIIPVLFLSNYLGSPLLPKTIECQDFEMALQKVESESDTALLTKWYMLDSHAQPPCYRLRPISTHIPACQSSDAIERQKAFSTWSSVVETIFAIMVTVLPQELRDTYLSTTVEQEVHNSVFMSSELAHHCVWLCRVFTHIQSPEVEPSTLSHAESALEQKRRLEVLQTELKSQLMDSHILRVLVKWQDGTVDPDNVPEHSQYIDDVVTILQTRLTAIVDDIIEENSNKASMRPAFGIDSFMFQELMQQTHFCQRAAQCSITREGVLSHIEKYITSDNMQHPLVLYGPQGCGKTALVARSAHCCHIWKGGSFVVTRFVGVTAQSSTLEQLLTNVITHCSIVLTGKREPTIHNVANLTTQFSSVLSKATSERPLIILIDGIDQVKWYGSQSIEWVPLKLPEYVHMILSVNEDSAQLTELKGRLKEDAFMKLPVLPKTSAQELLMTSVMQFNHSCGSIVGDQVKKCLVHCTLPLYVKVLSWQTSYYAEKQKLFAPKGNISGEYVTLFEDLEETLGKKQVEHALGLSTAAKFGLQDSEMLDLLSQDEVFQSNETHLPWAPACVFWARLHHCLWPFLAWSVSGGGTAATLWRDEEMHALAQDRYVGACPWAHHTLRDYFQGKSDSKLRGRLVDVTRYTSSDFHRRKLEELPFHTYKVEGSLKEKFLFNWEWLYQKICGSTLGQVLDDLSLELKSEEKDPELELLQKFLEHSADALTFDGKQFYSQVYGRLRCWVLSNPSIYPRLKNLVRLSTCPPVPSLIPLGSCTEEADGDMDEKDDINGIYRARNNSQFVVSINTSKEEVTVWDVYQQKAIRILKGIPHPVDLEVIDTYRCVILCGRELRVFDLNQGCFITKLKGVMNQKMPFYGLHDSEHLVALSRNRMYVNLMNLTSGDCVTTFKVGEDRFLNSLLVSENGRILVCGDETQKPFPLLVWDLSACKLMYDLRIPHHEFVTRLAAITREGHFVCSVCKEVDEPSPNFIIVYDLQSGTLFKKWKPGVSTVSISISSSESCVISGLEDSRILIWDLITGNCRITLCCHQAPPDTLCLDQNGARFLSCDSLGRDRTLRLWDLNKGFLLASYTPDHPVTCCELSSDGETVILALKHHKDIFTLFFRENNRSVDELPVGGSFGDEEFDGKEFVLTDER